MNFVSKITNNQSSIICLRSSVFSLLNSVSFFGFLSSALCPLSSVFMQNKPNSPIVRMNLNNLTTMNYAIFTGLTKLKNKPNSNPNKAKTKHVLSAVEWANTNPIKAKNQSSLITNHLEGKPNSKPKQTQSSLSSNVVVGDPISSSEFRIFEILFTIHYIRFTIPTSLVFRPSSILSREQGRRTSDSRL